MCGGDIGEKTKKISYDDALEALALVWQLGLQEERVKQVARRAAKQIERREAERARRIIG